MTLSQLKKDLTIGRTLRMTYNHASSRRVGKLRQIVKIQTNGVSFTDPDDPASRPSFFELPPASLLDYDGWTLTTYLPGRRPLTKDEQAILDNRPRDPKQERIDIMTDGSRTYWRDKRYFADNSAGWYWDWTKGLRYSHNDRLMWDKKIKGDKDLEYIFID